MATAERAPGLWQRLWRAPSLAARLSLVTAAVLAVALGMVSTVRTIALRRELIASTALQMAVDYNTLASNVAPADVDLPGAGLARALASPTVGAAVINALGQVVDSQAPISREYGNLAPPILPTAQYLQFLQNPRPVRLLTGEGRQQQLVVVEPVVTRFGQVVGLFELTTPVAPIDLTVRQQLGFDVLAGLLALIGASAAIYFLLGRFLAPLHDMARASDQIARGDLDVSLPAPEGNDEVSRLSVAFDHMVRRIDAALEGERAEQRRMRAFLADASHSLRTPLTVLNGRLDLLLRGESRDGDELERSLRDLRVEGERMARIVRGLLLLARLEEGDSRQGRAVDLSKVLEDLRPRLESLTGDRELVVAATPGLTAWATVDAIETIVTNLVENAARHTPENGSVAVRADESAGMARLRVLDSGSGIADDDLPHLFERFYRGAAGGRRRDGGAGLGLSIVQRWAEALGGRAEAANRVDGRGAEFTVWLRRDPPAALAEPAS